MDHEPITDDIAAAGGQQKGSLCYVDTTNIIDQRLRGGNKAKQNHSGCRWAEHIAMLAIDDEPVTYEQAMQASDNTEWKKAMDDEFESLSKNNTWTLVERPKKIQMVHQLLATHIFWAQV